MAKKSIEPTPADYQAVERSMNDARQMLLDSLARSEAWKRVQRERAERRRARLRRLTLGLLGR